MVRLDRPKQQPQACATKMHHPEVELMVPHLSNVCAQTREAVSCPREYLGSM